MSGDFRCDGCGLMAAGAPRRATGASLCGACLDRELAADGAGIGREMDAVARAIEEVVRDHYLPPRGVKVVIVAAGARGDSLGVGVRTNADDRELATIIRAMEAGCLQGMDVRGEGRGK